MFLLHGLSKKETPTLVLLAEQKRQQQQQNRRGTDIEFTHINKNYKFFKCLAELAEHPGVLYLGLCFFQLKTLSRSLVESKGTGQIRRGVSLHGSLPEPSARAQQWDGGRSLKAERFGPTPSRFPQSHTCWAVQATGAL